MILHALTTTAQAMTATNPTGSFNEPVWTWNFWLTAVAVPVSIILLGAYIRWREHLREKKEDRRQAAEAAIVAEQKEKDLKIEALKIELAKERENASKEWRERHSETLCTVKNNVELLVKEMSNKVNMSDCKDIHKETWDAVNELRRKVI